MPRSKVHIRGGYHNNCHVQIEAFLAASLPPADETKAADEEEEEEEEADQQPVKRQKRNGAGFGSMLSPAMQEFLGCDSMPRPQVTTVHRPQQRLGSTGR